MTVAENPGPGAGRQLHLVCPRRRLCLNLRASAPTIEYCPRCLGRACTSVLMLSSPLPAAELFHESWDSNPARTPDRTDQHRARQSNNGREATR
jgi:hypothetical protein